jgi:hypothetical protein
MFIVAGRNDPRVPWTEGQQMIDALRKNKVQDYLRAATAAFVRAFLLGQ